MIEGRTDRGRVAERGGVREWKGRNGERERCTDG